MAIKTTDLGYGVVTGTFRLDGTETERRFFECLRRHGAKVTKRGQSYFRFTFELVGEEWAVLVRMIESILESDQDRIFLWHNYYDDRLDAWTFRETTIRN